MKQSAKKHFVLTAGLALCVMGASAQELREGYVDFGANTGSPEFHTLLSNWKAGSKISADDNFFISRVKPHTRFRNAATQVRTDLTEENDKHLVAWIPVNNPTFNALPDGVFDSEVFSMWSYVTHWGDWTAPVGRIPAAFLDAAHKNGVPVSGVASIPYGSISTDYNNMLTGLGNADVNKAAQFFRYYGIDGMGYNSEFSANTAMLTKLRTFHINLNKKMKETNPLFEDFWYDGTSDYGSIMFDRGLAGHNSKNFGDANNICYSLFLNYNWNSTSLLSSSVTKAKSMSRSPLDLYAGVNMQGGEPGGTSWSLLKNYPISIGLWGAHSYNMFWESRGELGSDPAVKQNAYMLRTERYFGGGSRNPAATPSVKDRQAYNAYNYEWHGMASFMTARSAMSWDLSEEPLVTYFNLGNGKFFNLNGVRQHNKSWYNVGIQDYLPTWRWWFASKLLGRTAADVPSTGLDANFTWDDAYFGGSTIRISGSSADEYLHLFKTQYALKKGDVITFRYKLASGRTDLDLVLSAVGSESNGVNYNLCETSQISDDEEWVEKKFTVGSDFDGKDLALVALHFKNAQNLDLLLGEFSIVRGSYAAPAKPEITSASLLYNSKDGMDGKIIFNMANNKAAGEPCYNLDVNASEFRLYAQQEGQEPVLMTTTTSWAGLYYSIPIVGNVNSKVRLGVSAVSLDRKTESGIAWSNYLAPTSYKYNDDIELSKPSIKPGESFSMGYVDGEHPEGTWIIEDESGKEVFRGTGKTVEVPGLEKVGSYTLKVNGTVYDADGKASTKEREYFAYVQITDNRVGAVPEIYSLTANGSEESVTVGVADNVAMAYTGRNADGVASQGVDLKEKRFGARCNDLGVVGAKSFSVTFWLKLNKLADGETQLLSVANKQDKWPKTDWGWIWSNIQSDGSIGSFTFRGTDATSNKELRYKFSNTKLPVGAWAHIAYVFDYNASGNLHCDFYVNGVKQEVTAWNRSTSGDNYTNGDPGYQGDVYQITEKQVLAIGGDAFGRSGIDGAVDNVMVWDGAITADDVKKSMGDVDANKLPSNVKAFWNFEKKAGDANMFAAAGSLAGTEAGIHEYETGENEGQGNIVWRAPQYTSGCPFLADDAYKVETMPTWKANHAFISDAKGNGTAGSANISYAKGGDYTVTLTLANSLGSAQRTFSVIKVAASGINDMETSEIKTYTVGENAVVEFAETGNYEVSVYNAAGVAQAHKAAQLNAGNAMNIHLANAGIYVLTVKKDGKTVRTVKLVRK